jgi:hypothetical protein
MRDTIMIRSTLIAAVLGMLAAAPTLYLLTTPLDKIRLLRHQAHIALWPRRQSRWKPGRSARRWDRW